MMARGFGRIVNIVSRSVKIPQPELGLSNGARTGLVGFVGGLARQTVARNVTINNLLPGIFDSDAQRAPYRRHAERRRQIVRRDLARTRSRKSRQALRPTRPSSAPIARFLCSEHAGFITGQNLLIDGGSYPGILLSLNPDEDPRRNTVMASRATGCAVCSFSRTDGGGDLSEPYRYPGRTLSAGRFGRRRRAHPGAEARRKASGQILHRRKSRGWCWRHGRGELRSEGDRRTATRMLLTASIHVITPFLLRRSLRRGQRFHPDYPCRIRAPGRQHRPEHAGQHLKEFFDIVRKAPDKFTFATSSFGSAGHLAVELLKREAGVDTLVIAYVAPARPQRLMGGQTQLMADPMLSSLPLAQARRSKHWRSPA